ncbi:hypothetical protein AB7250_02545 [Providencia stuartii]|uniref:Uncharacterized protein n=1 Tax=Enterobacter quasimori TaxID=2838947 RepID=A0ABY0AUC2_9ENTR|nr:MULTISPECIES: hypothetical protein [Enterobacteriaceae]MCE1325368.1 hypothetical protein [Enterobacter asburiae]RTN24849.1 hypothetical protein EKN94_07730 [Enterobacter quasimori]HCM9218103.1 hypothetical protein [Enterobacter kobei]HCM9252261.1 hypothetical protein [Enterobacter cloacae subsp. dissolvens]
MSEKKKIDMLIWIKGIDEDSEGDVLKDAVGLKKYTDDIVVVAGPPEKLLAPEARRELLEDLDDDGDEEDEWDDEDWAVIEGDD